MKQHITPKQLMDIPAEHREILMRWAAEHQYNFLLEIGPMIQFVDERNEYRIGIDPLDTDGVPHGWMTKRYSEKVGGHWEGSMDIELCDALWEEVKWTVKKLLESQ